MFCGCRRDSVGGKVIAFPNVQVLLLIGREDVPSKKRKETNWRRTCFQKMLVCSHVGWNSSNIVEIYTHRSRGAAAEVKKKK